MPYPLLFASPFQSSAVVSVDGFGDFAKILLRIGNGSHLAVDGKIFFSFLRCFYTAITSIWVFLTMVMNIK